MTVSSKLQVAQDGIAIYVEMTAYWQFGNSNLNDVLADMMSLYICDLVSNRSSNLHAIDSALK